MGAQAGWRLLQRAGLALAILALLALGIGWGLRTSAALASRIGGAVALTARGPIEYAQRLPRRTGGGSHTNESVAGRTRAVLIVHGTPGGFGQVLPLAERLAEAGLHTIVFSRPGYLRTPLSVGRTFGEQADTAMALLDFLRIDTAALVGVSGGGPVALQIALRHPQRTIGLAMIAAVTSEKPGVAAAANPPGWRADLTALAASFRPDFALRLCGVSDPGERSRRAADLRLRSRLRTLFLSLAVSRLTNAGYRNDFLQAGADNPGDYRIERIQAPTLGIYGHLDSVVPAAQGERLAREITGSRLVVMPGHHAFFILDEDAMLQRLVPFLRKVAQRY